MTDPDNLALAVKLVDQQNRARDAMRATIARLVMEGVTLDAIETGFDEAFEELTGGGRGPLVA